MYRRRPGRTRAFVVTPYEPDSEGVLRAMLPSYCPFRRHGDPPCRLHKDHLRERKTGPCHALLVVRCSVHRRYAFTLYPPGHVPYGRVAVAPMSAGGELLRKAENGVLGWDRTLFAAVLDAARGERWSEDSPAFDPLRRRTQMRHVEAAGLLCGVHPGLAVHVVEQQASRLGVSAMSLRAGRRRWEASPSWTQRAGAVFDVLAQVPVGLSLADRLLASGHLAGLWLPPHRWDPLRRTLHGHSEGPEHLFVGAVSARAPPATKSQGAPS